MANKIKSVLTLKCPRCGQSDMFKNRNVYKYDGFFDMPEECPTCQQDFLVEPGFYYGAMYISYGLTIAVTVAVYVVMAIFDVFSIVGFLVADVVTLILALPYLFKVSRTFWLALIVKPLKEGHSQT